MNIRSSCLLAAALAGLGAARPASAVQVVNFGGDLVSVNANFRRLATNDTVDVGGVIGTTDARAVNAFSNTTPLSPSSGYTGPTFYGGYQAINFDSATSPTYSRQQVNQSGAVDRLAIAANALDVNGGQFASAVVFQQADFLNGQSTGTITFGSGSSLSVTSQNLTAGAVIRLIVQNGTNYFVSSDSSAANSTLTINPTTTTFAPYNPLTNLNFNQAQAFVPQTFNNVTGVGYYVEADTAAAASTPGDFVSVFTADTGAVPEPTSLALVTLGGAGLLARRRPRV